MRESRVKPGPGQESVWDYPRPPRLEDTDVHLRVVFGGVVVAETRRAKRVLETSHPPVYYIPQDDIRMDCLAVCSNVSFCEWKGEAVYYTVEANGKKVECVAWSYPHPPPDFAGIKDHLAFARD